MTGLEKETRLGQGNGLGARSQEHQWFRKGDRVSLSEFAVVFELLLKIDQEGKLRKGIGQQERLPSV